MKLRIWWNSNFGNEAFYQEVDGVDTVAKIEKAKEYLDLLAKYDLYLGDKIDANACGLEEQDEKGFWSEYYDDEGRDICEIMRL